LYFLVFLLALYGVEYNLYFWSKFFFEKVQIIPLKIYFFKQTEKNVTENQLSPQNYPL